MVHRIALLAFRPVSSVTGLFSCLSTSLWPRRIICVDARARLFVGQVSRQFLGCASDCAVPLVLLLLCRCCQSVGFCRWPALRRFSFTRPATYRRITVTAVNRRRRLSISPLSFIASAGHFSLFHIPCALNGNSSSICPLIATLATPVLVASADGTSFATRWSAKARASHCATSDRPGRPSTQSVVTVDGGSRLI